MRRCIRLSIVRQLAALAIVCSLVAIAAAPASAATAAIVLNPDSGTAGVHTVTVSDSTNSAAKDFAVLHGPKPAQDWAVIVGVSDYLNLNSLQYADDDAQDIYNRLTGQAGSLPIYSSLRTARRPQPISRTLSTGWGLLPQARTSACSSSRGMELMAPTLPR